MRWLLIGLLVSLGALLVAAAAIVRHVQLRHAELRARAASSRPHHLSSASEAEEHDLEP